MTKTYVCDDRTTAVIEGLRSIYGVASLGAALKRVIALNLVFVKHVDPNGTLRLRDMRPDAAPDATIEIPTRL